MHMEFRATKQGGHMRVRVFVGKGIDYTLANAGSFMLHPDEWICFKNNVRSLPESDLEIVCYEEKVTRDFDGQEK